MTSLDQARKLEKQLAKILDQLHRRKLLSDVEGKMKQPIETGIQTAYYATLNIIGRLEQYGREN